MSATDNRLLKQCKLKFQNCYELNGGTVNATAFVGKFMQNIRIGNCSLRLIGQLSGQFLLISVFADGIGACLGLAHGETLGEILPYYLIASLSLYLYFSVSGLIDVPGKKEALETTITDFLENRMSERMKSVKKDSAYLEELEKDAREKTQERTLRTAQEAAQETVPAKTQEKSTEKAQNGDSGQKARVSSIQERRADSPIAPETGNAEEELEELLTEFLA